VRIPFLDLRPVHDELRAELAGAVQRVVASSHYVLGPEVEAFEHEFARFCGARHCVGVGNGMQAIELVLRALGIGAGDEVVTVSHTAFPTAAAVTATGATPVFVDVDAETCCMRPEAVSEALGPRTRAVLPVHLYGRCADIDPIRALAADADVPVVEDAAQAHGAAYRGSRAGTLARAAAFSFYPTKNLGALGDGGAVVTDDDDLALHVRRLRNYGEESKYVNVEPGFNSRLDELQAAILRVKLAHLERWNAERRTIAALYDELLAGCRAALAPAPDAGHVYHLYVVRSGDRDGLQAHLADAGIGAQVHYPTPVHRQAAYAGGGARAGGSLATTEALAGEVLSLPAYPGLGERAVREVAGTVRRFCA
jgi:dTDP-3-amino-3,4,6-trideoxy-alpha-D-glucose transaminase